MINDNRLEGMKDMARYCNDCLLAGDATKLELLLTLIRDIKKIETQHTEALTDNLTAFCNMIKKRISYLKDKIAWGEDVNFDQLSKYARGFTAGQNTCYRPDIYFLESLLEKLMEISVL
jgi:hypothetical protein